MIPSPGIYSRIPLSQPAFQLIKDHSKNILLFQVGWKTTSEYYTFMWAPLPSNPDSKKTESQQIHFKGQLWEAVAVGGASMQTCVLFLVTACYYMIKSQRSENFIAVSRVGG